MMTSAGDLPLGPRTRGLQRALKAKDRTRREALSKVAENSTTPVRRNDLNPELRLLEISLDTLRAPPRKVRALRPEHVLEISNSIRSFGVVAPLLVDASSTIVDGVARFEAARQCGLSKVPCIQVSHLSPNELRLCRLAINRLAEKGDWELEELRVELTELISEPVDIGWSGFSGTEIDQILTITDASGVEEGPLTPDSQSAATARPGDIFEIGAHRIACGSATDPELMAALMGGASADLVLTDQPYNVKIQGHVTSQCHREFAMASGEMTADQFRAFNVTWMALAFSQLRDGGLFGTYIDWRGLPSVHAAATEVNLMPINLIVWAKANAGMGNLYRSQHELLPLFKKGNAPHVNNVELGKRGRWRSNVWSYPGASSFGSDARRGLIDHPTVKPTAMLEDALLDMTNAGDVVLDPFLGSGSTLVAAQNTRRRGRGIEIDPLYVDLAVRRLERVAGTQAILFGTESTFAQIAAKRSSEVPQPTAIE